MTCQVVDSSKDAEWRKDGQILQNTDRLKVEVDGIKHTLQVSNSKPIDSGEYCIYFNNLCRKTLVNVKGIIKLFTFD